MLCDVCKQNPATITIKKFINGEHSELHLCETCAKTENAMLVGKIDLSDFVKNVLDMQSGAKIPSNLYKLSKGFPDGSPGARCPACGLSFDEFRKTAKLGCMHCYSAFDSALESIVKRMHGRTVHTGKVARGSGFDLSRTRQISDIEQQLMKAVSEEKYELAAEYRDMIKIMQSAPEQIKGAGE